MASCHLHELHFTVKGHHLHSVSRGVFDLRHLLAGVGVDDPAGLHTHRLHELDLGLAEETRIRSRVNTGLTLLHSYRLMLMTWDSWRSHVPDLRDFHIPCSHSRIRLPETPVWWWQPCCHCTSLHRTAWPGVTHATNGGASSGRPPGRPHRRHLCHPKRWYAIRMVDGICRAI